MRDVGCTQSNDYHPIRARQPSPGNINPITYLFLPNRLFQAVAAISITQRGAKKNEEHAQHGNHESCTMRIRVRITRSLWWGW
jgi:hypothetical protein